LLQALIGIEAGVLRGIEILNNSKSIISEFAKIVGISSITRSINSDLDSDYEVNYNLVLKISTNESPEELINRLMSLEQYFLREYFSKNFQAVLLSYAELIHLVPHLVLPHPQLVQNKSFLIGSIELWPQYNHPILEKPLSMLCSEDDFKNVEFISPGMNNNN
jgi:7,8-dihydro-6-hydroxymethylpterin-pyrophosphokinase